MAPEYVLQPLSTQNIYKGCRLKAGSSLPSVSPEVLLQQTDSSDSSETNPDQDSDYQASQEQTILVGQRGKRIGKGSRDKPRNHSQQPDPLQKSGLQHCIQNSTGVGPSLICEVGKPVALKSTPGLRAALAVKTQLPALTTDIPVAPPSAAVHYKHDLGDNPDLKPKLILEEEVVKGEDASEAVPKPVSTRNIMYSMSYWI